MNPVSNISSDISKLIETYNSLHKYQYSNYYDDETQKFVNPTDNPLEYSRAYAKAPYSYITSQWQYHMDYGFKNIVRNTKSITKEVFNNINEIDLNAANNITQQLSELKAKIDNLSQKNESNSTAIVQEFLNNRGYLSDIKTFPTYIQDKFLVKTANAVNQALVVLEQREQALEAQSKFTRRPPEKLEEEPPAIEKKEPPFDYLSHQIPFFTPLPRDKLKDRDIPVAQQERLNYFLKTHHKNGNMLLAEFNQTIKNYKEALENNIHIKEQIKNSINKAIEEIPSDFSLDIEKAVSISPISLSSGCIPPPPPPPLPGAIVMKTYAQKKAEEAEKQSLKEEDVTLQSFQLDDKGLLMMQLASNESTLQETKSQLICYLFGGEHHNKEVSDPVKKFNSLTEEQFNYLLDRFITEAIRLENMSKIDWETSVYNPGAKTIIRAKKSVSQHKMTDDEKICSDKILQQVRVIEKLMKDFLAVNNKLKNLVEPKNLITQKANRGEIPTAEELIHYEKLQSPENQRRKSQLSIEKKEINRQIEKEVAALKKVIHSTWNSPPVIIKDAKNLISEIKNGRKADFVSKFFEE